MFPAPFGLEFGFSPKGLRVGLRVVLVDGHHLGLDLWWSSPRGFGVGHWMCGFVLPPVVLNIGSVFKGSQVCDILRIKTSSVFECIVYQHDHLA